MRTVVMIVLFWMLGMAFFPSGLFASSFGGRVENELRAWSDSMAVAEPVVEEDERNQAISALIDFYSRRDHAPVWVAGEGPTPQSGILLDALRDSSAEGLCPEDYHVDLISFLIRKANAPRPPGLVSEPFLLAYLDLLLSDAFFRFASDHLFGRAVFRDPSEQKDGADKKYPINLIEQALSRDRLKETLAELLPSHPGYRLLMKQLERYRRIAVFGGWPKIPMGKVIHPGDRDARVPLLRTRLSMTEGEVPVPEKSPERLDESTAMALRHFQKRHGLIPDGVVGARTLGELNVTAEERVRRIEWNLERWRWMPKEIGKRYLQINIADFSLQMIENDQVVMSMAVIVGTEYRKTPEFSGTMTYLELAPYWYVPPTILREDKLPLIRRNPGWLEQKHFEIVSWKNPASVIDPTVIDWHKITEKNFPGALRQKPGLWNPLGQVKFIFPNRFAIYLHDTPERYLFKDRVRLFSSGCIRIERPLDLAQYLLELQGVSCDELMAGVARDTPLRVPLQQPIPVHIMYRTAWVETDGTLQFRNDYYLRDLDMETALEFWRAGQNEWRPVGSEEVFQPVKSE